MTALAMEIEDALEEIIMRELDGAELPMLQEMDLQKRCEQIAEIIERR